jgi:tetratricopeptide (TPR) repeat protein
MLLGELGKMSEAEQAFRTAFKADPHSAQAAYNLGVMLYDNHPHEALDWCSRAAELAPENPKYGYTYAFYLYQSNQREAALRAIRKVRDRFPSDPDSLKLEQALTQEHPRSTATRP